MLYFAYGMNTNSKFMSRENKRLGPATLLNYGWEMLQFANVFAKEGEVAVGILWDIDDKELARLDVREGYPDFYDRVEAEVMHNGEKKKAWVYYMTDRYRRELAAFSPSKTYYDGVIEGYAEDNLAPV